MTQFRRNYWQDLISTSFLIDPIFDVEINLLEKLQKRFLKYCSFRKYGVYPSRGSDYIDLCSNFDVLTLNERRILSKCKFIYNLLNSQIDCPYLLNTIDFKVPRLASRSQYPFYLRRPTKPIGYMAPIYRMCKTINDIFDCSDFDFDTFSLNALAFKHNIISRIIALRS